ncbi:MAG: hypothetical protein KAY37_03755 [Phycisphaerae bacterium]|nr:hypothetical protein [Phycisphaerae bacterium]
MSWPQRRRNRLSVEEASGPPITPEELTSNLSDLERKLNREMKCTAGKNQVYIRSLLTGMATTRPRIALKCPLRRDINLPPEIFYEQIRDVCCCDPDLCEAWRDFKNRHVVT